MLRVPRSGSLLAAALVAFVLVPAGPAAAEKRPAKCQVAYGTTVAQHGGQSLIVADVGEDDELYGAPQAVFVCRSAKARPVRISTWPAGTSIAIRKVRWARDYVAYSQFGTDDQCAKYSGVGAAECTYSLGGSYDLRSGKRRAAYDPDANVATTVLSPRGWIAVLTHPDASGDRELSGSDGRGQRPLANGPIDLGSVRFRGAELTWTVGGVPQRVLLEATAR